MRLIIAKTAAVGGRIVADIIEEQLRQKPDSLFGLATGGSVVDVYKELCDDYKNGAVDFSQAKTVNPDEYLGLPREHSQSFAGFLHQHLLSKTNFNTSGSFQFDGSADIGQELCRYNQFLQRNTIDLLLLGIGTNGHIGFNEPDSNFTGLSHSVELLEETIQSNSRFFDDITQVPKQAVTIGMYDVIKAKKVVVVAFGKAKAKPVAQLFTNDKIDPMLPVSIIKLSADAIVVVDSTLGQAANLHTGGSYGADH